MQRNFYLKTKRNKKIPLLALYVGLAAVTWFGFPKPDRSMPKRPAAAIADGAAPRREVQGGTLGRGGAYLRTHEPGSAQL